MRSPSGSYSSARLIAVVAEAAVEVSLVLSLGLLEGLVAMAVELGCCYFAVHVEAKEFEGEGAIVFE